MTTLKKTVKKAFSASVVFMTAFLVLGVGVFVPTGAFAALYADPEDVEAGDYISFGASVYFIDEDMHRNYFPHSSVFQNWEPGGFSSVSIHAMAPSTDLDEYFPQAGGVNYRPGCQLVKTTVSPRVYAVLPGNKRAHIATEEVAVGLYGANWSSLVRDVADVFWGNLTTVDALDEVVPHDGMVVKAVGGTTQYYVMDGMLHEVEGNDPCVRTVAQSVLDELEMADETVTAGSIRSNPAQSDASSSNDEDEDEDSDVDEEEPSGDVSFSLSAKTPESSLVPEQATQVPYLAFNVTAGSEDALIRSITFERYGLGDEDNFDKVWLAVNDVSVSSERSVQSDNSVELAPNYTIGAGQTVTFFLMANLDQRTSNPDGTEQDGFRIMAVDANGADVSGATSVKGNHMFYSTYALGTAAISTKGTAQDVEVGDEQEIVGEFEIDWTSQNENDGMFKTIRFKMDGTADSSDLENVKLYEDDGTVVSEKTDVWGDYYTFVIKDGEEMFEDGEARRFEIRADIADGDADETIIFVLEDNRDFYFVEEEVNVGSAISVAGLDGVSTDSLKTYTVDAGQFTVSLNGKLTPSNEEYAKNTDEIVALVADVDLGQCVAVDGLKIYFSAGTTNLNSGTPNGNTVIDGDIASAELWVVSENGKMKKIATETSVTDGGGTEDDVIDLNEYYYDFDQSFQLQDNDMIKLVLNLEENAATNTYKFTFSNAGGASNFTDAEYCLGSTNVATADKSGTVTGNNVAITAASFSITRNDGFSTGETFVAGSEDELFFQFLVDAGTSSDITIRTLNFDMADGNGYIAANYTKFTNFYLKIDGEEEPFSENEDLSSAGSLTFQSLNKTIEKDEQVSIGLYGSLQTSVTATTSLIFTLDGSDSSFVDQEDDSITYTADDASAEMTISAGGTLTVSVDGDTADANIYAVGATGNKVTEDLATFKLVAQNDDITVTDFYFANNTTTGGNTPETDSDFLISKYQLVVDGKVLDEKNPTDGKVRFELSSGDLIVEKDGTERVTVRAVFNKITDEAQSGRRIALALYALEAESDGPGTGLARNTGVTSTAGTRLEVSDTVADLDLALTGETMAIYQSIPTVAGVSLGTNSLNSGTQDIYKFTVSADAQGDISWAYVALDLTGECKNDQDAAQCITDINLYEITSGGSRQDLSATFVTSSNNTSAVEARIGVSSSTPNNIQTVAAGTTKTYVVEATFAGIQAADSISVRMRDHSTAHFNPKTLAGALTSAGSTGPIVWSDNSGVDADASEAHWYIGRDVPGFDTLLQTFEKAS